MSKEKDKKKASEKKKPQHTLKEKTTEKRKNASLTTWCIVLSHYVQPKTTC